jgi:UDP-2-acetamido-3-amino-2,3-dideoxy-glucuronate N-acetyltransferase
MESINLREQYSLYKSKINDRIYLILYHYYSLYKKMLIRSTATNRVNYKIVREVIIVALTFVDRVFLALKKGWIIQHGHILKAGENGVLTCPESGFRYQESDDNHLCCMDLDENQPLPPDLSKGTRAYDEYK